MWNAVRKSYCSGDFEERIYDEPNTADTWWDVDVSPNFLLPAHSSYCFCPKSELPNNDIYPHCYLPLHFWLDKGMVTRRVKKYPMVLRPVWLLRQIRNASGNGGGVLVGYMPIVRLSTHVPGQCQRIVPPTLFLIQIEDLSDPTSHSAAEKEDFAHFKREVYQKILKKVFRSLKQRSNIGEAHRCADGINRILYPGILIESQDAEEAAYFCGCRAASANHPCPKCLVAQQDLHNISDDFELRTPQSMQVVLSQASKAKTKTAKETILKDHGLHNIEVISL